MKRIIKLCLLLGLGLNLTAKPTNNPLLQDFKTKFGVPPFDKIKPEHFLPAFQEAMKEQNEEVNKIINNYKSPNFENTIAALEYSGELLRTVSDIFFNVTSTNTNDEIQKISQEVTPLLSKHSDNITLNEKLFQRIKSVYDSPGKSKLKSEQIRLLENTYREFVRNGANLNEKQKERLKALNEELSVASLKFGDNVLAETNNFKLVIDNKKDLSGLPESLIKTAEEDAKATGNTGKWVFTLDNPSVMPFLQYADNRALREKIWTAYIKRSDNNNEYDNKELIKKIVSLRHERAVLLGFNNYAAFALDDNMAKNPDNVYKLLKKVWAAARPVSIREAADMQAMIDKSGKKFKLAPWDWRYYAEKLRKEKYDLDEEMLKPYFKLENVIQGVFTVANKLYGITFKEIKDIPKLHPDATGYEVKEANGKHLGVLYMDFFPRKSKRGGAWMSNYREQYRYKGKFIEPVVTVVGNFSKPFGDTPSLLTFDEVSTLFHEFGHSLHGLFSNGTYPSLSGTNVPRDFVELPSQVMENWAAEPEVLRMFARHYKTNEIIPQALIDKLENSKYFNQGFATVEYLAASFLDMDWHTLTSTEGIDVDKFSKESMDKIGLIPEIIERYRSVYFRHIFSGGYESGYYSYIWAEVLDADAFEAFKEHGIFDNATATSFRKNILEKGYSDDPMQLYIKFRGKAPEIEPLLKRRGLMK